MSELDPQTPDIKSSLHLCEDDAQTADNGRTDGAACADEQEETVQLSDEQIRFDTWLLTGFQLGHEGITRQYFYGYCLIAYKKLNQYYNLSDKPGLDFYSLVHDYYLYLYEHDWKPLEDKSPRVKLSTWMLHGFRFLVLDKLKQYNREYEKMGADTDNVPEREESTITKEFADCVEDICATHFSHDSKAALIARKVLIEGYQLNEVAQCLHMSPSAVSQRYKTMREKVIIPYFKKNFAYG